MTSSVLSVDARNVAVILTTSSRFLRKVKSHAPALRAHAAIGQQANQSLHNTGARMAAAVLRSDIQAKELTISPYFDFRETIPSG